MEMLTQTERNEISRVLKIKKTHSEYEDGGGDGLNEEEDVFFGRFQIDFKKREDPPNSYINHLFPVFYYEWSRRQIEEEHYHHVMFLNLLHLRTMSFTTVNFDVIDETNHTSFKQRFNELDEIFKKYSSNNMTMIFIIPHPLRVGEWEKTDMDEFLENDTKDHLDDLTMPELLDKFHELQTQLCNIVEGHERLATRYRILQEENEELKNKLNARPLKDNGLSVFKDEECIICLKNKPNILFCNCGHLCICEECENMISNSKCPKCRTFNSIKRKIF